LSTLLIADDDPDFRRAARVLVSGVAEIVTEAPNGEEAVKVARAVRPDVVLMDLRMPLLDGAEAARRIKAELPATKILMITAYESQAERLSEPAVEAVITKRRFHSHLLPMLRSLLAKAKDLWDGRERRRRGPSQPPASWDGKERRRSTWGPREEAAASLLVPADVRAFLTEHIDNWEQLETLLLLRERPQQYFHPEVVADRLRIAAESAAEALYHLAQRGLAEGPPAAISYRYRPAAALRQVVDRLAAAHAEDRVALIRVMNANAIERIRRAARERPFDEGDDR
jgi:CheY-like chemotaxis protein